MSQTKYLIIGSSHAGLSALDAIRTLDETGSVTIVSRENTIPYSPTILPYVVSGDVSPDKVPLRDADYFEKMGVDFRKNETTIEEYML